MRRLRISAAALLAAGAVILGAMPANAGQSNWNGNDLSPTVVQAKGTYYSGATLSAPSGTTGTIWEVDWSYKSYNGNSGAVMSPPSGASAQVCDATTSSCVSVISALDGSTTAFNGRPATDSFYFRFYVSGSGALYPKWQLEQKKVWVYYTY